MGEKDDIFSGASQLFFATKGAIDIKELPIMENSVSIESDNLWKSKIPPMQRSYSFDCSILDNEGMGGLVDRWFNEMICKPLIASICVRSGLCANRPNNLKYPNKKRAKRIWNKWRNRYGAKPIERLWIPDATVSVEPILKDGMWVYQITADCKNNR